MCLSPAWKNFSTVGNEPYVSKNLSTFLLEYKYVENMGEKRTPYRYSEMPRLFRS